MYSHRIPFELLKRVRRFIEGKDNEQPAVPQEFRDRIAKVYHGFDLKN